MPWLGIPELAQPPRQRDEKAGEVARIVQRIMRRSFPIQAEPLQRFIQPEAVGEAEQPAYLRRKVVERTGERQLRSRQRAALADQVIVAAPGAPIALAERLADGPHDVRE